MRRGFTYLGLLLVLAIILFLCYQLINIFLMKTFDKESKGFLSEQDIDTTTYKTAIDSTREKMQDIARERAKQLEDIQ